MTKDDQNYFPINTNIFDTKQFCQHYVFGIRTYLLKENLDTLSKAKKKYRRLEMVHYTFGVFYGLLLVGVGYVILRLCGVTKIISELLNY